MIFSSAAKIALLLVVLSVSTIPAMANIGDTIAELRGRYGSAKDMGVEMLFQHDGYSICVYFDGSRSAMEVFVRDGSKEGKDDITQKDVDQILASEGGGMEWRSLTSPSGRPMWVRADGKIVAKLTVGDKSGEKYLTIMANEK